MRRKEREISKKEDIIRIIEDCRVLRIAMNTDDGIYMVPVNFGFEEEKGKLVFYVHGALQGRKLNAIKKNPDVCIECDCRHRLIEGEFPCEYSYEYASVIANGKCEIISDSRQKVKALEIIMKHQTGKNFQFAVQQTNSVSIIKITAEKISAKANLS